MHLKRSVCATFDRFYWSCWLWPGENLQVTFVPSVNKVNALTMMPRSKKVTSLQATNHGAQFPPFSVLNSYFLTKKVEKQMDHVALCYCFFHTWSLFRVGSTAGLDSTRHLWSFGVQGKPLKSHTGKFSSSPFLIMILLNELFRSLKILLIITGKMQGCNIN